MARHINMDLINSLYEYRDGELILKTPQKYRNRNRNIGDVVGSIAIGGKYKVVNGKAFNNRPMLVHRIIYTMFYGEIPNGFVIDHLDGNGLNNKIENLRLVKQSTNLKNQKRNINNKLGIAGVRISGNSFIARINNDDGKEIHLGSYKTIFDAACARISAQNKSGYTERHGR